MTQNDDIWFYSVDGKDRRGPISKESLIEAIVSGKLHHNSLVWRNGFDDWVEVGTIPELSRSVSATPPPLPTSKLIRPDGTRRRVYERGGSVKPSSYELAMGDFVWVEEDGSHTIATQTGSINVRLKSKEEIERERLSKLAWEEHNSKRSGANSPKGCMIAIIIAVVNTIAIILMALLQP